MHLMWPPTGLLPFQRFATGQVLLWKISCSVFLYLLRFLFFFSCYSPLAFLLLDDASRILIFELLGPQVERQMGELSICTHQELWCGDCANNSQALKHSRGVESRESRAQACSKRDTNEWPLKEIFNSALPRLCGMEESFAEVRAEVTQ